MDDIRALFAAAEKPNLVFILLLVLSECFFGDDLHGELLARLTVLYEPDLAATS